MQQSPDLRAFSKNLIDLKEVRKNWSWFLLLGIILIGLGILAVATSTLVTVISIIIIGSLLLVGGFLQIGYSFWLREWSGFSLSLLAGILYTAAGFMFVAHPTASAISLTLLLGVFYVVSGLFRTVMALMARFEHWGWALFSGLISVTLGLMILAEWPATGLWVLGLFIGIDLIFMGWFWVMLAIGARSMPNDTIQ